MDCPSLCGQHKLGQSSQGEVSDFRDPGFRSDPHIAALQRQIIDAVLIKGPEEPAIFYGTGSAGLPLLSLIPMTLDSKNEL